MIINQVRHIFYHARTHAQTHTLSVCVLIPDSWGNIYIYITYITRDFSR